MNGGFQSYSFLKKVRKFCGSNVEKERETCHLRLSGEMAFVRNRSIPTLNG